MKLFNKIKSELPVGSLGQMATLLVIVGITIAIAALILTTIGDSTIIPDGSVANGTVDAGLDALGVFSDWLTIIAIVLVAVVVLSLIKFL
jgi:hypothetical protein